MELSYLASEEQKDFLSAMDYAQAVPSHSQAQRIKKLALEGECTLEAMCEIMNEVKKMCIRDRETVKELARLLGGVEITEAVLQNAREMKELASQTRLALKKKEEN